MKAGKLPDLYIIISYLISLIAALLISAVIITATYYIHEGGHILFGYIGNILHNSESSFNISNWVNHPIIPYIKVPQQTTILKGYNTLDFVIGGMLLDIVVFSIIAIIIYKHSKPQKKKFIILILLSIIFYELVGNFLCGTDNHTGKPLTDCSGINSAAIAGIIIIFSITMYLQPCVYSFLLKSGKKRLSKKE